METQLQKVGVMQAVRIIITVFFMVSSIISFCQEIKGQYSYCDPAGVTCKKVTLSKNRFTALYSGDFGINIESSGYYLVIQDTLILFHVNPNENDTIAIESKVKPVDLLENPLFSTQIILKVIDEAGQRMPGVNILLRNQNNKILKGMLTDKGGMVKINLSPFTEVDNIHCSWLSDEKGFKIAGFLGYESVITLHLLTHGIKKSSYSGCEKYLILKSKTKQLSFKKVDGNETLR